MLFFSTCNREYDYDEEAEDTEMRSEAFLLEWRNAEEHLKEI